jgi:hypothetical protein
MSSTTRPSWTNQVSMIILKGLCLYCLLAVPTKTSGQQQPCIQDFNTIYELEDLVTDTSILRTYIVCPNTLYTIGLLDFNYNVRVEEYSSTRKNPPLPLRPNMNIRCGDSGLKSNLCFITEGDIQLDGTPIRGINDPSLENIVIEGFIFMSAIRHSLWAMKTGSITFRDCEWTVRG